MTDKRLYQNKRMSDWAKGDSSSRNESSFCFRKERRENAIFRAISFSSHWLSTVYVEGST